MSEKTSPIPLTQMAHKRNRQNENHVEEECDAEEIEADIVSKKPRDDNAECFPHQDDDSRLTGNSDDEDEDDEDDDDDDDWEMQSDGDDYLDDAEDDVSTVSEATSISTCSSVSSTTPSLIGENLESFSLGECELKSASSQCIGGPLVRTTINPLRRSLFSHVPPFINFMHHNEVPEKTLPPEICKHLRWKLSNITPAVVKRVVSNSGYRLMRKNAPEWCATWGKHMRPHLFKDLHDAQKINHLPGTFCIGRKDSLWHNYRHLRVKHGREDFSFLPRTFCLPKDTKLLRKVWAKKGGRAKWIVKPPALARGTGISVVNKWSQIPKNKPMIVQNYISRPHLINETKYDLRIYVLVTCINPLTIYFYDEGLVRFASKAYSTSSTSLSDVFTHLTNYSINKNSSTYKPNEDSEMRQGHKWTLTSLWSYMAEQGLDAKLIKEKIKDLVIKTIISAERDVYSLYRANMSSHYIGYELFGFDILLDSKLKPWLIEVNISPSLHSSSPLDMDVKSPLTTEVFNLARYHVPPSKIPAKVQRTILEKFNMSEASSLCLDRRLYTRELSKESRAKQKKFVDMPRSDYLEPILENLSPDDVRFLIRLEDELSQASHFMKIFPTPETHKYFKFFDKPGYYNLLTDAWETKYSDCRAAAIDRLERLCQEKVHLKVPLNNQNLKSKTKSQIVDVSVLKAPTGNAPDRPHAITDSPNGSPAVYSGRKSPDSEPNNEDDKMSTGGDTPDKSRPPSPEPSNIGYLVDNQTKANKSSLPLEDNTRNVTNTATQKGNPFIDDNHSELI